MVFARPDEHSLTTTTMMMMMMISGILGDQLGLFLGASLPTITKVDGDDDDDDDGGGDNDGDNDDDDFRHSGWSDGSVSGRQSADDH